MSFFVEQKINSNEEHQNDIHRKVDDDKKNIDNNLNMSLKNKRNSTINPKLNNDINKIDLNKNNNKIILKKKISPVKSSKISPVKSSKISPVKSSVKIIKNTSPPKNIENQKFKKENIVDKEIDKK
jgi:hypothetical protein